MHLHSIPRLIALSGALALLACKDTTASGPSSIGSQSDAVPSSPVFAKLPPGCKAEHGDVVLSLVPNPAGPFSRTMGPSKGGLKGAATSNITSLTFGPGAVVDVTSEDAWVLGPTDMFMATGAARWVPFAGFNYNVDMTLTITGGAGKYDGATGTIHLLGVAHEALGPFSGFGDTYFDLHYEGSICT